MCTTELGQIHKKDYLKHLLWKMLKPFCLDCSVFFCFFLLFTAYITFKQQKLNESVLVTGTFKFQVSKKQQQSFEIHKKLKGVFLFLFLLMRLYIDDIYCWMKWLCRSLNWFIHSKSGTSWNLSDLDIKVRAEVKFSEDLVNVITPEGDHLGFTKWYHRWSLNPADIHVKVRGQLTENQPNHHWVYFYCLPVSSWLEW